ncbi:uncharacterized protein LOC107476286 [Arachis duranensis]|uniref:acylphosphatase n=1 Tax=Arachis duranensis TaxID=130453 RepID=A0A6P4CHD9_ARADU|nr:uncharacterized protein LOC107476286 [Arachis duranensis]
MASIPASRWVVPPRLLSHWINAIGSSKTKTASYSYSYSGIISDSHSHYSYIPVPIPRRCFSAMATPQDSASTKTERVVVKGKVQGVFYRNWTIENATQLGLKGWVRNRRDGSVEALFSGPSDAVQEMEQRCRRGPPDAIVTGFEAFPSTDDPGNGFEGKPTV